MNRKILMAGGVIAFVTAITLGATYAAWSAQGTIEGNTIGAGTISLSLEENPEATFQKPVEASEMFPGDWSENYHVNIVNDGNGAGDVYMYADEFVGTGGICASTNLVVEADSGSGWFEKYNGPIMDTEGEANKFSLKVDPLESGETLEVRQRVELDVDAPNTAQGQECTWSEVFVLEQA